jgi:hypothetical protein
LLAFTCVMFWPPANGLETKPKLTPTHHALLYTQPSPTYQFTITNQTKPNGKSNQTTPVQCPHHSLKPAQSNGSICMRRCKVTEGSCDNA